MNAQKSLVQPSIELSDGKGLFRLASDGSIEVLNGYNNVGQVYQPGLDGYEQVLSNLAQYAGNRGLIEAFRSGGGPASTSTPAKSPAKPAERWELPDLQAMFDELDDMTKAAIAVVAGVVIIVFALVVIAAMTR